MVPLPSQVGLDFLDGYVRGDTGAVGGGPNLLGPRLHHKKTERREMIKEIGLDLAPNNEHGRE